jgi:hypothetical protein
VLRTRERAQTPSPFTVFTFGLAVESIKELGGVSKKAKRKDEIRLNKMLAQESAPSPITQNKGKIKTSVGSPIKKPLSLQIRTRKRNKFLNQAKSC